MSEPGSHETRERCLRQSAHRQGYAWRKSRWRNGNVANVGNWRVVDRCRIRLVAGDDVVMSLEEVELFLNDGVGRRAIVTIPENAFVEAAASPRTSE